MNGIIILVLVLAIYPCVYVPLEEIPVLSILVWNKNIFWLEQLNTMIMLREVSTGSTLCICELANPCVKLKKTRLFWNTHLENFTLYAPWKHFA